MAPEEAPPGAGPATAPKLAFAELLGRLKPKDRPRDER
jgi:hypothetical protein